MAKQTINNLESAATVRSKLNANFTELYNQKADKSHAFPDSSYGAASSDMYGHVKIQVANGLSINDGLLSLSLGTTTSAGAIQLVDSVTSTDSNKALTANQGKLLKDEITSLNNNTAPKNHATSETTYGVATGTVYGHIKVTAGNGLNLSNGTISISSATTNNIGTVKLNNTLTSQSDTQALTAYQGYLLDQKKTEVFTGTNAPSSNIGRNGDLYILTN